MIQHREKLFRQGHDESYVKEKEVMEYTKQRKENERGMSNLLHDLHKRLMLHGTGGKVQLMDEWGGTICLNIFLIFH